MEKILTLQKRLSRKEKNKFLDAVEEKLTEYGYEFERKELGSIIKSVNLETKTAQQPDYIFVAHYDTPTMLPFWFSWLFRLCGQTNQALVIILGVVLYFLLLALMDIHLVFTVISTVIFFALFISLFSILIPNRKNFDDNTSGVIALLSLAKKCKERGIENVKFLFVDNEEIGLFGSMAHRSYLEKERLISPRTRVVSLDCVGAGNFPLIIRNGKSDYAELFYNEIQKEFAACKSIRMIMPLSDNFSFRRYGALNISFVNKAVIPFEYYIPNVHSCKDNRIDLDRIEKLTDVLVDIAKITT